MLTIKIVKSLIAFEALESDWQKILSHLPNHQIFQTFEWNFIWWKYFGRDFNLYIMVIERNKVPVAILPLMFSSQSLGFIKWKKYEFIGKKVSNTFDLILLPDENCHAVLQLIHQTLYLELTNLDYVLLRLLPDNSNLFSLPDNKPNALTHLTLSDECSYRVQLDDSWDQYCQHKLSKKLRYDIKRQQKRLNEQGGIQFHECRTEAEIDAGLKALYQMKIAQRRALNEKSFYEEEAFSQFDHAIAKTFIEKGWLFMHCLFLKDKIIAVNFDFKYLQHIYCHEIAYDNSYKKYSPGRLLQFLEINKAFDLNMKVFDFAWDDSYYKRKWCNNIKPTQRIYLLRQDLFFQRFYLFHLRPVMKTVYLKWLSPGMRQKAKKLLGINP